MKRARRAELDDALGRLNGCGADLELIELAKRCLSADPAGRPSDAEEASAAVTAYRESVERRLRAAEVASAEAKVKAVEGRKRHRVALALAASVLLAATGAAAGAFWYHAEQTHRAAATERDVTAALAEATALGNQGATLKDDPAKWEVALSEGMSAVKRAEGVLHSGEGTEELRRRIGSVRAELESAEKDRRMIVRLEEAMLRNAEPGDNGGGFDNAGSAALFAAAFKDDMGLDLQTFNPEQVAAHISGRAIGQELLDGLDDWLFVECAEDKRVYIQRILQAADPEATSFRNRLNAAVLAKDRRTLTAMATGDAERDLSPINLQALGRALDAVGAETEALRLLRAGQSRDPTVLWINFDLAQHLQRARPPAYEESIRFYTVAAALHAGSAGIHNTLGSALWDKGDLEGAAACFRRAIELNPKFAGSHNNLGIVLRDKGDLDGAAASFRRAIELNPKFALAQGNLGWLMHLQGDQDGALALLHKAIELDPKNPQFHNGLGLVLRDKGDSEGAAACFRRAIELDPKNVPAHDNLGWLMHLQGDQDGALALLHKAIELDPKNPQFHNGLGLVLRDKGDLEGAAACFRRAIEIDPKNAAAHDNLAEVERLAALQDKLPALLKGEFTPQTSDELHTMANLCKIKKLFLASARMFAAAFAADPKLADDLKTANRYNAACYAALAAAGQSKDNPPPDEKQKAELRRQALSWLRADLDLWKKQLTSDKPEDRTATTQQLRHWQQDSDLSGLRDAREVAKLPADEQEACKKLWADVQALLDKAGVKK